jgi:Tol biopolymer transport system component
MNVENVESLLERGRPAPPPSELRRRIVEAAALKVRPGSVSRKPRFVEVMTVAASILMLFATLTWLLRGTPPAPIQAGGQGHPFEERRLTDQLASEDLSEFFWSSDGKHWACVVPTGELYCAVVDGKPEAAYSGVGSFSFGADGRYAYLGTDAAGTSRLIVNGKLQEGYVYVSWAAWSPDGRTLAFVGQKGDRSFMVVDGKASEPYDCIGEAAWSPDGRLAYVAALNQDWFCVLDGKKEEPFDQVLHLKFSPDGKSLAYAANEGTWTLVVDGKKGEEYEHVGPPSFSPDGRSYGYVATDQTQSFLVLGPRARPDQEPYEEIGAPVFSRDGKVWAFRARAMGQLKSQIVTRREMERKHELGPLFDSVDEPVVSPDGRQVAYAGAKGSRKYLVVGGKPTLKYSVLDRISFGPDGETLAYRAGQFGKQFVIAGKSRSDDFEGIVSGPVWSSDGKKVAFTARNNGELWSKVLEVK